MRELPLLGQFPCWPGRCGVCIGFEKDQDRYIVRLITGGVESDVALRRCPSEGRWGIRHLVGPGKCVHSISHTQWTNISPYAKSFLVSVKINIGAGLRWYSTKTRLQGSELQHLEAKASGRLGASAGAGNLSCLLEHLASSQQGIIWIAGCWMHGKGMAIHMAITSSTVYHIVGLCYLYIYIFILT